MYLPLGITHRFQADRVSRISTSLEYNYLISGMQTSYLSDIPGYSDLVNKQNNGYGFRLSSAYEKRDWSVGVFYNHWSIKDSEINDLFYNGAIVGYGLEPKNNTNEYGVQVKYRF